MILGIVPDTQSLSIGPVYSCPDVRYLKLDLSRRSSSEPIQAVLVGHDGPLLSYGVIGIDATGSCYLRYFLEWIPVSRLLVGCVGQVTQRDSLTM